MGRDSCNKSISNDHSNQTDHGGRSAEPGGLADLLACSNNSNQVVASTSDTQ